MSASKWKCVEVCVCVCMFDDWISISIFFLFLLLIHSIWNQISLILTKKEIGKRHKKSKTNETNKNCTLKICLRFVCCSDRSIVENRTFCRMKKKETTKLSKNWDEDKRNRKTYKLNYTKRKMIKTQITSFILHITRLIAISNWLFPLIFHTSSSEAFSLIIFGTHKHFAILFFSTKKMCFDNEIVVE